MLHVGHAVHEGQPDETLRGLGHHVQEHVEHHSFLHPEIYTVTGQKGDAVQTQ